MRIHKGVQITCHGGGTDEYPPQTRALDHERHRVGIALHRQHADERNFAAEADGLDGLRERTEPTHLDHVVEGATGELGRLGAPLRFGPVVERGVGAELPRAYELRVARGSRHDPRAGGLGDPQREERHAAGADQQHPLAALERTHARHQRIPRGHPRAGECRRLFEAQRASELHDTRLGKCHVVGEHSFGGRTAERRALCRRRRPLKPGLEEGAGHPISASQGLNPGTDRLHDPGTIGERSPRHLDGSAEIAPLGDGLIAVVEGRGVHAHEHLPRRRIGLGQFHELELLNGCAPRGQSPRAHSPRAHRASPVQVLRPGAVRSSPARARATAGRAFIFSRHSMRRGQRLAIASSGNMRSTAMPQ